LAHTVRVAVCAAENARAARVFEEDAIVAAALHDCAKYLSPCAEELKGFTPPPKTPPTVIHQYAGAYVAERIFGVTDTDILNTVRYHTTGRENMSKLEKLVYLADLLEEGHDFEGVEKLRAKLKRGIDECFVSALERQIDYLEREGVKMTAQTRSRLDEYNDAQVVWLDPKMKREYDEMMTERDEYKSQLEWVKKNHPEVFEDYSKKKLHG